MTLYSPHPSSTLLQTGVYVIYVYQDHVQNKTVGDTTIADADGVNELPYKILAEVRAREMR